MVEPSFEFANVGDKEVEFSCYSKVNVTWSYNEKSLPSNAEIQKNRHRLKITNIRRKNAGNYTCYSAENYIVYHDYGVLEVYGEG